MWSFAPIDGKILFVVAKFHNSASKVEDRLEGSELVRSNYLEYKGCSSDLFYEFRRKVILVLNLSIASVSKIDLIAAVQLQLGTRVKTFPLQRIRQKSSHHLVK